MLMGQITPTHYEGDFEVWYYFVKYGGIVLTFSQVIPAMLLGERCVVNVSVGVFSFKLEATKHSPPSMKKLNLTNRVKKPTIVKPTQYE